MANIVEGLFGLTPSQVQQQQQAQINAQAAQYANADPFQRATMGMYQGGAGLAGIGAGMMGLQNRDVAAAQEQQQFASQIDMTTPEGVMEGAKAAQARGDSAMAIKLVALARQMQEEQSTAAYRDAQSKQMLASAEGKPKVETSSYAKELVDAGYAYGTPEFNAKMREYLAGKNRVGGSGGSGGGGMTVAQRAKADKALDAKQGAVAGMEQSYNSLKSAISKITDESGNLTKPASGTVGKWVGGIDLNDISASAAFNQKEIDALSQIKAIQSQVIMGNLAAARKQADQSFGSMQQQEWDRFLELITTLNRKQSPESFAASLKEMLNVYEGNLKAYKSKLQDSTATPTGLPSQADIMAEIARRKGAR